MRLSPPSRSCSTKNSRKNSRRSLGLALFFLLPVLAAFPEDVSVTLDREQGDLFATLVFRLDPTPVRLEPVEAGLKSRMLFTLQFMERREGLFSFLGDITVSEHTVEYSGYKDFLEDEYVLEDAPGRKTTFAWAPDFFKAFTRLERVLLNTPLPRERYNRCYFRAQARYFPVKLVAPLTLIYVLSPGNVIESGWQSAALPSYRSGE